MNLYRLGAGVIAVVALIGAIYAGVRHYQGLRADRAAYAGCVGLVADPAPSVDAAAGCDAGVAQAIVRAAAAVACDAAIVAEQKAEGSGALRLHAACSPPVKRLFAEVLGLRGSLESATLTIEQMRADRQAAIARAEARVRAQERKKAHAEAAIARAPRAPDGRIVCGVDCLRALSGEGLADGP